MARKNSGGGMRLPNEQWRGIIADFLESGMTRKDFAAARGLNYKTLCNRLVEAGHSSDKPAHAKLLRGGARSPKPGAAREWVDAGTFQEKQACETHLPKIVLALAALAFVGVVVPNVFGLVKGFLEGVTEDAFTAPDDAAVEFVIPEAVEIDYEPTTASMASMPAATDGVTGFTLVADESGYVPAMSAEQQAAVQSVLDQYAPNNRTVGFVFMDLRTGSGYAYNVDADVYGASSFKAHVAVFACQDRVESGAIKWSSFRQSAEAAVVWSDNGVYYRLRNASGTKGDALRNWLSGMGLDPEIAEDTFPTYSAREAATLWMNTYLYLKSGDPSLTSWLASLMSTTNVSMLAKASPMTPSSTRASLRATWSRGRRTPFATPFQPAS